MFCFALFVIECCHYNMLCYVMFCLYNVKWMLKKTFLHSEICAMIMIVSYLHLLCFQYTLRLVLHSLNLQLSSRVLPFLCTRWNGGSIRVEAVDDPLRKEICIQREKLADRQYFFGISVKSFLFVFLLLNNNN